MVTAVERVNSATTYKDNYYVNGYILFCKFCNITVDYKNKSKVDQHLRTNKHKNNKAIIEKNTLSKSRQQTTLETFENTFTERDEFNLELVKVFTAANIPLEKVNKLRPFFRKYCKNGNAMMKVFLLLIVLNYLLRFKFY